MCGRSGNSHLGLGEKWKGRLGKGEIDSVGTTGCDVRS